MFTFCVSIISMLYLSVKLIGQDHLCLLHKFSKKLHQAYVKRTHYILLPHTFFSAMDPKLLPSQCVIVVSPVGKIYLINAIRKIVLWSYVIPKEYLDNKIYEAMQKGGVSNYMDVHVDEFGGICLYLHNTSKPPKAIPLISCDQVRTDITSYFGNRVTPIINVNQFNLDYEHGKRVQRLQGIVDIEKTEYEIIASEWRLRFSKYQARVIFNDNCSLPIHVYHTHELKEFSHLCCTTMSVVDESLNYDIWIIQNMTLQKLSLERNPTDLFVGGSEVIVKSFPKTFPSEVRTFLSSNNDKFLIFHGVKSDENDHQLIFEHCKYTLYERLLEVDISARRPIIRDLVDGLRFLHGQNICHTELNPWNVMITNDYKLKISGFNLKPSTKTLVDEDLRALGKLIAFCYSNLINPNKRKKFTVEKYDAKKNIKISQSTWACEATDIANQLQHQKRPPSLDEVSLHPFLWSSGDHFQFYMEAKALLEPDTDSNRKYRMEMYNHRWDYFGFLNWKSEVPSGLFEQQIKNSTYNTSHPWCLLRFIRNILGHHPDVSKGAHLESFDVDFLGSDTSATEFSFRSKFPYFLTGLYYFLKENVPKDDRKSLKRYYEMDTN